MTAMSMAVFAADEREYKWAVTSVSVTAGYGTRNRPVVSVDVL